MDMLTKTAVDRRQNPEAWARDRWVEANAERLAPGSRVLDAGAGATKYRDLFSHCQYESQDFCQYDGPLVQYTGRIDHVCEITSIPLPDGCLDAILCTEVIEHVPDPMGVLDEFARLLKPGGQLWLTAPLLSSLHMEPYHYYGGFTPHWYQYWLPKKGFKMDEITPVGGPCCTAVIYLDAFRLHWAQAVKQLPPVRKGVAILLSLPVSLLARSLRRMTSQFDAWLGNRPVCSGYLVRAVRQ